MAFSVDTVKIKKLMIDKDINTIGELSQLSGVNRNTLSGVISGKVKPSTKVMESLIRTLDIESSDAGSIFFVKNIT